MIKFRVKQEPPAIDDESLIQKVKQHEFLYNTRNADYRNLPLRNSVWSNITEELGVEDQTVVQKRWKVLREKFSLAYRKYKKDGIVSSWSLYNMCTYLIPFVNLKPDVKKGESDFDELQLLLERKGPPKSPFDETLLIQLIREQPVLYDKQHEDFRAAKSRKKAWIDVAKASGWDVTSVQKRWRVMRDRFVRELRRTKNIDTDNPVNCSSFFRDMLFLVRHVKSKNYEAEATDLSDADVSEEHWSEINETTKSQEDRLKSCTSPTPEGVKIETVQLMDETIDEHGRMAYAESSSYVECYESTDTTENEVYLDSQEYGEDAEEYYEEEDDGEVEEEALKTFSLDQRSSVADADDVDEIQEISEEQWFKSANESSPAAKKRKTSLKIEDEVPEKKILLEAVETTEHVRSEPAELVDEDASFGQTIGLMLRKIPARLKTSVKLKILQSIADFELQHNLV